ncbi:hypothetical protein ANO11243_007540 [Dothideomycetidae sp. 11243]|nr:hypothetical protein ANO11243_007540 [fungal sp. No.11243]
MPLMLSPSPPPETALPHQGCSATTPPHTSEDVAPPPSQPISAPEARIEAILPSRQTVRARRRRYLVLKPEYFSSAELAEAEPKLYHALVRRFQSAAEREAVAKRSRPKGAMGTLADGIARAEERRMIAGKGQAVLDEVLDGEAPRTKKEGLDLWRSIIERRFVDGQDGEVDYGLIDGNAAYDDVDEDTRRRQDEYFDKQQEQYVGDGEVQGETGVQDF